MSALPVAPSRPIPWSGAQRPPRRWQREALPIIGQALREGRRPVISAATGSGKSVLIAELCWLFSSGLPNDRVVVVTTPTEALVEQLAGTIARRCGAGAVGQFFGRKKQPARRIVVTCNPSAATLATALRARGLRAGPVVVDECHRSESDQMQEALAALSPARLVGFTATPFRSAEDEALSAFDCLAYRYTLGDALSDEPPVLVPWNTVNWLGSGPDADTNRICVELIREHGIGPGIVSALSIPDAEAYAARLTEEGLPAAAIYGEQPRPMQQELIARLRAGELRALVHVQLLAEGVDLPWLRWLCLRRPVGSAVRFLQEIGRVIRVDNDDPTKRSATIIDPHDLFGSLGIHHDPRVGAAELEDAAASESTSRKVGPREAQEIPEIPPAKAIDIATAWTRKLLLAMQSSGLAGTGVASGSWRGRASTDRQVAALLGTPQRPGLIRLARYLPEPEREAVKALAGLGPQLQAGAVSDLIDVLSAIAEHTRDERQAWAQGARPNARWKFPPGLVPPLDPAALSALPESNVVPFARRSA